MNSIYSHRYDNTSTEDQLSTLTLSLKSIEGSERNLFDRISSLASNNNARIEAITRSTNTLTNVVRNLYNATIQLIRLEKSAYTIKGRYNEYASYEEEKNFHA